jgi:hypothetical protein
VTTLELEELILLGIYIGSCHSISLSGTPPLVNRRHKIVAVLVCLLLGAQKVSIKAAHKFIKSIPIVISCHKNTPISPNFVVKNTKVECLGEKLLWI